MNPDQAIDRVLKGLAATQTLPDMEERVLSAVQSRTAAHHQKAFRLPGIFTVSRPWAIAAGLIILSLAASMSVRRRHELLHADVLRQYTSPQPQTSSAPQVAEAQPISRPHQVAFPDSHHAKDAAATEDINDLDAMAVIEMNAPSHPAPPLPLTHQEKLLAAAVNLAGPEKLSTLRPEVMAQQMELSKAEFHDFFEPPPPPKVNE